MSSGRNGPGLRSDFMPATRTAVAALAVALVALVALVAASCASNNSRARTSDTSMRVATGEPFPVDRCAANRAAGTVVYRSGFGFAASASIVDVLVAEQKGYFANLCLDVEIVASDAAANYAPVADNTAQFASAGSFNDVIGYRHAHPDAGLVVLAVEGQTSIDSLVVKEGAATTLSDLRGTTIGVKGSLPASVRAMLAKAGLREGTDFDITVLDGHDPELHIADPGIVGFPVFQSTEPGQLDRAGIDHIEFDPADDAIPGTFGIIYTNASFLDEHPTAAQDFMRATMLGLADAVADPSAASMIALDFIANSGNAGGLSADTEAFRWQTESGLVVESTPRDGALGLPVLERLEDEVRTYAGIGFYDGDTPDISDAVDADVLAGIYGSDRQVIWPSE